MIANLIALVVLLIATGLFWGVGVATQWLSRAARVSRGPMAIGIGVAAVVFVGGILNLAHMAYAPALWTLALIALVVTILEVRKVKFHVALPSAAKVELLASALVIAAVILFTIATQLPPREFNYQDDFQKYFAHPVRMLETGTLAGSPLSALGSETLGGEAFLQGFVASARPLPYINGVDAVFGLFGLMLVSAGIGWRRILWFPGAALGPLLIATVNPQYVNISGLYLGALLMATAMLLVAGDEMDQSPRPFILGLIYAALIAIKPTFGLFPLLHLFLSLPAVRKTAGSTSNLLRWFGSTAGWTGIGLLPWVALYIPNYFARGGLPRAVAPPGNDGTLQLFSTEHLFYGGTFLQYTAVALFAAVVGIAALFIARRTSGANQKRALGIFAGAFVGPLAYLIIIAVMGPSLNGYSTNLRYAIPYLLGTSLIAIVLAPTLVSPAALRIPCVAVLAASLLIVCSFLPSLYARAQQAARFGSILAFPQLAQSPAYIADNEFCLSPSAKVYIRGLQYKLPAGEALLAWINTPFWLDYRRNTIIDADTMGISSRWARIPPKTRYVLWQYRGYGVRGTGDYLNIMRGPGAHERNIAAQDLVFGNYLSQLAATAKVIASDNEMVLFELHQNPN